MLDPTATANWKLFFQQNTKLAFLRTYKDQIKSVKLATTNFHGITQTDNILGTINKTTVLPGLHVLASWMHFVYMMRLAHHPENLRSTQVHQE